MIRGPRTEDAEAAGAEGEAGASHRRPQGSRSGRGSTRCCATSTTPAPDVTLVLLAAKPDRRRNPWKRLSHRRHGPPGRADEGTRRCARTSSRSCGGAACGWTPTRSTILIDEVGQDLRRLMGEVDKLEAWGGGRSGAVGRRRARRARPRAGRPALPARGRGGRARPRGRASRSSRSCSTAARRALRILATLHRSLRQVRAAAAMLRARVPRAKIAEARAAREHAVEGRLAARRRDAAGRTPSCGARSCALDQADRRMKRGADAATTLVAALAEACAGRDRRLLRGGEGVDAAREPALVPGRPRCRARRPSWRPCRSRRPSAGRSFFAASASPVAMAARSFFTWVFSWEMFFRLRARRLMALPHLLLGRRVMSHSIVLLVRPNKRLV